MIDSTTAKLAAANRQVCLTAATRDQAPSTKGEPAEVAKRFESIFVQQFVGAMRASSDGLGEGMFGKESGNDTYTAWFDQFMAEHIVRNGGVGLAKVIESDMQRHHGVASSSGPGRMAVTA